METRETAIPMDLTTPVDEYLKKLTCVDVQECKLSNMKFDAFLRGAAI